MSNRAVSPKSVRRIIVVGDEGAVTIHKRKSKSRKHSSWVKPFEKAERRVLKAVSKAVDTYRNKHDHSSRKRKDGWIEDAPKNMLKAMRKGEKKLKIDDV